MKVLQIVSISFSLKYFIGNQFTHFKEMGVSYAVACSPSDDLFEYAEEVGFEVFPLAIRRDISPIQDVKSILRLYRFIKSNKFDVVIAHSPKGGLIGMVAAFLARTPKRIFFRHGLVFETSKGIKRQLLILIEKITSFCADKVVNVSPSIQNQANKLKLNRGSKNIILGKGSCNGVDIHKFSPRVKKNSATKVVVGFVGRLSNDKGISELVEAWKLIEGKYDNIELLLIGPMDERDTLVGETKLEIETSKTIRYIGEVKDSSYYYGEMDIFILPSYREGFPTVILEASASQLPIITTRNTGCIDSIIEDMTGIFTELSPHSIAERISYYIENPEIRITHGKNGRKFVVDNFSEKYIYDEIEYKLLS